MRWWLLVPHEHGLAALTLAFGLIVTVQGFETSRYLGAIYPARARIRSMRWAQMLSTLIYIVYIALTAYVFRPDQLELTETAIVDMMAVVAPVLPAMLVAAALAAQFSAAVADTGGSGGLMAELTQGRLSERPAYAVLVAVGLVLTWTLDVFHIIAYASRAFALYYALQSAIAAHAGGAAATAHRACGLRLLAGAGCGDRVVRAPRRRRMTRGGRFSTWRNTTYSGGNAPKCARQNSDASDSASGGKSGTERGTYHRRREREGRRGQVDRLDACRHGAGADGPPGRRAGSGSAAEDLRAAIWRTGPTSR